MADQRKSQLCTDALFSLSEARLSSQCLLSSQEPILNPSSGAACCLETSSEPNCSHRSSIYFLSKATSQASALCFLFAWFVYYLNQEGTKLSDFVGMFFFFACQHIVVMAAGVWHHVRVARQSRAGSSQSWEDG